MKAASRYWNTVGARTAGTTGFGIALGALFSIDHLPPPHWQIVAADVTLWIALNAILFVIGTYLMREK